MHDLERYGLYRNQSIPTNKLIKKGTEFLYDNDIYNAKNEIEWFLQNLFECDKIEITNLDLDIEKYNILIDFLLQRSQKIPFQYLLGKSSFYGRDFEVDKSVLIPRPESELLINIIKDDKYNSLLDIGTGCGCIAITAVLEKIVDSADGVDISDGSLNIATKNAELLNAGSLNFFNCNILKDTPNKKYDIIISNPPYISMAEYESLDEDVKNYEPAKALTDFDDGLIFYRRFSKIIRELLIPNGIAVFELSHFFKKADSLSIFNNFSSIDFFNDLNNDCRAVKIVNK